MSHVIVTGNGQDQQRSRYRSKCPACGKFIEIGQPIRPFKSGKRTRWQHEDCDNVPPAPGVVALSDEEARQAIADLKSRVKSLESRDPVPRVIHVRQPDGSDRKIEGHVHPIFERVLELATARKHIFIPGPSGCGKSHLAKQVADALGLRFGFISCSAGMSESQLLGRMVPHGDHGQFEFLGTEFLDCYENGGVFLFDEMDAADSNVLLVINAALANGHLAVPSRHGNPTAKRHPDFVCIAAANTWGRGADRQYVGRNELDEATLDRFRIGTVPMDYSEELERALCPSQDLYKRLREYRLRAQLNRLERIVSTRFVCEAYEMVSRWGWTDEQVDQQLFNGWRDDEIQKVAGSKGGAA